MAFGDWGPPEHDYDDRPLEERLRDEKLKQLQDLEEKLERERFRKEMEDRYQEWRNRPYQDETKIFNSILEHVPIGEEAPTFKQYKLVKWIAEVLNIAMPEVSKKSYSDFISKHIEYFKAVKEYRTRLVTFNKIDFCSRLEYIATSSNGIQNEYVIQFCLPNNNNWFIFKDGFTDPEDANLEMMGLNIFVENFSINEKPTFRIVKKTIVFETI